MGRAREHSGLGHEWSSRCHRRLHQKLTSATKLDKIKNLHVLSVGGASGAVGGGGVVDHYNSVYGKAYPRWIRV